MDRIEFTMYSERDKTTTRLIIEGNTLVHSVEVLEEYLLQVSHLLGYSYINKIETSCNRDDDH